MRGMLTNILGFLCCLVSITLAATDFKVAEIGRIYDITTEGDFIYEITSSDPINTMRSFIALYSGSVQTYHCHPTLQIENNEYDNFVNKCKANSITQFSGAKVYSGNHLDRTNEWNTNKDGKNHFVITTRKVGNANIDLRVQFHAAIEIGDGQPFFSTPESRNLMSPFEVTDFSEGCIYSRTYAFFVSKPKRSFNSDKTLRNLPVIVNVNPPPTDLPLEDLSKRIKIEYMFSTPTSKNFEFKTVNEIAGIGPDEFFEVPMDNVEENEIGWIYVRVTFQEPTGANADSLKQITQYQFLIQQQTSNANENHLEITAHDFTTELGEIPNLVEATLYGFITVDRKKFADAKSEKENVLNGTGYRSLTITAVTENPTEDGSISIMIGDFSYPSSSMTFRTDSITAKPDYLSLKSDGEYEFAGSTFTNPDFEYLCENDICRLYVGITFQEHTEHYLLHYKGWDINNNEHMSTPTIFYEFDFFSLASKDIDNYESDKVNVPSYVKSIAKGNVNRDFNFFVNYKSMKKTNCVVSKPYDSPSIGKSRTPDYFISSLYYPLTPEDRDVRLQTGIAIDSDPSATSGTLPVVYITQGNNDIGSQILLPHTSIDRTLFREDAMYYGAVTLAHSGVNGRDASRPVRVRAGFTYPMEYEMEIKARINRDSNLYIHFDPKPNQKTADICVTVLSDNVTLGDTSIEIYASQKMITPGFFYEYYKLDNGATLDGLIIGKRRKDLGAGVYCATFNTINTAQDNEIYAEIKVASGISGNLDVAVRVGDAGVIYDDIPSGFVKPVELYITNSKTNYHIMQESQSSVDVNTSSTGYSVSDYAFIKIEYDLAQFKLLFKDEEIIKNTKFDGVVRIIKGTANLDKNDTEITPYLLGEIAFSSYGAVSATKVFKVPGPGSYKSQIYIQFKLSDECIAALLKVPAIANIKDKFFLPFNAIVEYVSEGYNYGVAFATTDYTPIFHRVKTDVLQDLAFAMKTETTLVIGGTKMASDPDAWDVIACPQQPAVTKLGYSKSCINVSATFAAQEEYDYKTWVLDSKDMKSGYWWFSLFPKREDPSNPNAPFVEAGTGIMYDVRQIELLAVDSVNQVPISRARTGAAAYNTPVHIYDILIKTSSANNEINLYITFEDMGDNMTVYVSSINDAPIMPVLNTERMNDMAAHTYEKVKSKESIVYVIGRNSTSDYKRIYVTTVGASVSGSSPSIFVGEYNILGSGYGLEFNLIGKKAENGIYNKLYDRTGDSIALFVYPLPKLEEFANMDITVLIEPMIPTAKFAKLVHNKEWSDEGANYYRREPENLLTTFITNDSGDETYFPTRSNAIFTEETRSVHAIDIEARKLRPTDEIKNMYIRVEASQYLTEEVPFQISVSYTHASTDDTNIDQLPFDTVVTTKTYKNNARDYSFIDAISVPLNLIISPCQIHPDAHLEVYISPYTVRPLTNYEWYYNGETDGDAYDKDIVLTIPGDSDDTINLDFSNMLQFVTITARYDSNGVSPEQKTKQFEWSAEVAVAGADFRPTLPSYNFVRIDFDDEGRATAMFRPSSINDCRDFPEVCAAQNRGLYYSLYRVDSTMLSAGDVMSTACGVELIGELIAGPIKFEHDRKETITLTQESGINAIENRKYYFIVMVDDSSIYEKRRRVYEVVSIAFTGTATIVDMTPILILGSVMLAVGLIIIIAFIVLFIKAKRLHDNIYRNLSSVI